MLTKRVIPCLDVDAGRVVKGVQFVDLKDAGDPVEIAQRYYQDGADEIAFLDITASLEQRAALIDVIERVARAVFIPLTVGGGVSSLADVRRLLNAGADRVSINSAAVANPDLVREISDTIGAQCLVVAIDARQTTEGNFEIYTHGGRNPTGLDAVLWAQRMADYGAGELLVTSMDRDGTHRGFDLALTRAISDAVPIPIIASGGVGSLTHLGDGLCQGGADAVLAASIFHFGQHTVQQAKTYLAQRGIPVRMAATIS